jgi:CelD/BcsL family acetyltransferase involved in cellulose biosynthesis
MFDESSHDCAPTNTVNSVAVETVREHQPIDLQVVQDAEQICEFAEHWDDLFARAVDAPPFLSRPWMYTFVREGRLDGTPLFLLAWSGPKLVALHALAVRRHRSVRKAAPISSRYGFYLGLLLDPDHRSVTKDIAEMIASKNLFDVYCSEDLASEDWATSDLLDELARRGYSRHQTFRNPCFRAYLDCSFEEYFRKNASSKSRQNLRRRERRLFESGVVKIEHYVAGEVTTEILGRIAAIEQQSWLKRRGAAALHKPFYQKLLFNMAHAGFGSVWLMTIDGNDAAFEYVLVSHKKLQFGWRAFDLKYASSMSVGQILMMHTIRDACDNGITSMDIGHGESDYKQFWAKDNYSIHRVVSGRGLRGRLMAAFCYAAWRLGENERLRSSYRRVRKIAERFK